ncbi:DUF2029 domain-containing protein [Candidatus Thorarchaeota archaeon]|nr:MAG: DUF2029 domain-containing protein [Candidatus Thorarchaeota archaeon]
MEGRTREWMSWCFLVITVIIHGMFISSLWTGALDSLFHDTQYLVGQGADFFAFYQAGHSVLNGLDCYVVTDPLAVPYLYPYRYLPYFAYSFGVIINLLPPTLAYWLWVGVLTLALWSAVWRTRSLARALGRPEWEGRIAMGMWFIFSPVYIELYLGQVTLLAGILLFFALTGPTFAEGRREGTETTATLWTISGLIKLIPFLTAPVLLAAGRTRTVLAAAASTLLAVLIVPAGLESLQFFLDFNSARNFFIAPYPGSHSLKMLIFYLIGEATGDFRAVTVLLAGVFLAVSLIATLHSRDVWSCAGLFALSYFFIMTDVWEHHYTFILPFLVLAWVRGKPEDRARWVPVTVTLLLSLPAMPIVAFVSGASPGANPGTWDLIWQILYHSSKVVPTLVFYGWLLFTATRYSRTVLPSTGGTMRGLWDALIKGVKPPIERGILVSVNMKTDDGRQSQV